jgi:hypothetical protein
VLQLEFFRIVPDNFFTILTSKSKHIYLDALFVIRKAFKTGYNIKKEDLVSLLIEGLQDKILDIEVDEDDMLQTTERNLSSQAHSLLRKLKETHWINSEYLPNQFDEYVILEDYARKIINVLYDISNISRIEYNGFVYQTYSVLKDAHSRKDDYVYLALLKAYENSSQLDDALKSLLNNIKQYHQILSEQIEIKDMLKGHFEFKELISDRIIHPIKTFDSIPRFKSHILNILKEWQYDYDLKEVMVKMALKKSDFSDIDTARENIVNMIGEIIQIYTDIEYLLDEIDRKNNNYTRAWAQKVLYSLNVDKSIKGKIVEILKNVEIETEKSNMIIKQLSGGVLFTNQYIVDETSLSRKYKRRTKEGFKPLKVNYTETDLSEAEFKLRVQQTYTTKKIKEFILEQLNGRKIINTEQLRLDKEDNFVKIILSVLRVDEKAMNFSIEFRDGYIYVDGYRLPDMNISMKG